MPKEADERDDVTLEAGDESQETVEAPEDSGDGGGQDSPELDVETIRQQAVEELASKIGWRKDFPGGVDAATFIEEGKKFQKRYLDEIKDLRKKVEGIAIKTEQRDQEILERQERRLKEQRREAIQEGDVEKVDKFESQLEKLREKKAALEGSKSSKPQDVNAIVAEWQAANPWYGSDQEATYMAEGIWSREADKGTAPEDILHKIDEIVGKRRGSAEDKKMSTGNADTPAKKKPAASDVMTGISRNGSGNKPKKIAVNDLDPDRRAILDGLLFHNPDFPVDAWLARVQKSMEAENG